MPWASSSKAPQHARRPPTTALLRSSQHANMPLRHLLRTGRGQACGAGGSRRRRADPSAKSLQSVQRAAARGAATTIGGEYVRWQSVTVSLCRFAQSLTRQGRRDDDDDAAVHATAHVSGRSPHRRREFVCRRRSRTLSSWLSVLVMTKVGGRIDFTISLSPYGEKPSFQLSNRPETLSTLPTRET